MIVHTNPTTSYPIEPSGTTEAALAQHVRERLTTRNQAAHKHAPMETISISEHQFNLSTASIVEIRCKKYFDELRRQSPTRPPRSGGVGGESHSGGPGGQRRQ